jgi:hypothetical protein
MDQSEEPPSTELKLELWVIRTRLIQGLTPHIEDLDTLLRVVDLLGYVQLGGHVKEAE